MNDFLGTERFTKACNDEAWERLLNACGRSTKIPEEDGKYQVEITVYSEDADMDIRKDVDCILSTEDEFRFIRIIWGGEFNSTKYTVEKFKKNFEGFLFPYDA